MHEAGGFPVSVWEDSCCITEFKTGIAVAVAGGDQKVLVHRFNEVSQNVSVSSIKPRLPCRSHDFLSWPTW